MNANTQRAEISARIIADSISPYGERITTFELEYPRFILAELNTHRIFSKNAASSRAIPIDRNIQMLQENPATPDHWGKNQPGMQAATEMDAMEIEAARAVWLAARDSAIAHARVLTDMGGHKQWVNRILEPWQFTKTILTGTEFENLWWLRDHNAAQPEFRVLARKARDAYDASTPVQLSPGQWHVPYVSFDGTDYKTGDTVIDVETAKKISASCCAQVSYRRLDESVEKALDIYNKLVGMDVPHFSPFEHQATPMSRIQPQPGTTHMDVEGDHWSGNLRGWIQNRQLIMLEKGIGVFSKNVPAV